MDTKIISKCRKLNTRELQKLLSGTVSCEQLGIIAQNGRVERWSPKGD
jgi:hypothetical protein